MMAESSPDPSTSRKLPSKSPASVPLSPPPSSIEVEEGGHSSSSNTTPAPSEPEPNNVMNSTNTAPLQQQQPQPTPTPPPASPPSSTSFPPRSPPLTSPRPPLPSELCTHTILSTLTLLGTPSSPLPPKNGYTEILKTLWSTSESTKNFEFQKEHEEYIETFGFASANPLVELGLETGETTSGSILGGALVLQLLR